MIPEPFDYFRPSTVREAVLLAQRYGGEAKFLSGGHTLLPLMKLRLASPKYLIDLGGISELAQVSQQEGWLRIGALASHHAVERSQIVAKLCPLLAQTAAEIGDVQVRNCGTIGGSVAHADPAADYPAALLALDAQVVVEGPSGQRTIAAGDFFRGLFSTALEEGELVVAVQVPVLAPESGTAYRKLRHPASGFAIAGAAAVVAKDAAGKCHRISVALTGVGPRAFRASGVEQALVGKNLSARGIASACQRVAAGVEVQGDIHASSGYRSAMADVFACRAICAAAGLAT